MRGRSGKVHGVKLVKKPTAKVVPVWVKRGGRDKGAAIGAIGTREVDGVGNREKKRSRRRVLGLGWSMV